MGSVRIVFRKDGIAGKGTFGVVQKVKILKITNVDTASNTGNTGSFSKDVFSQGAEYQVFLGVFLMF